MLSKYRLRKILIEAGHNPTDGRLATYRTDYGFIIKVPENIAWKDDKFFILASYPAKDTKAKAMEYIDTLRSAGIGARYYGAGYVIVDRMPMEGNMLITKLENEFMRRQTIMIGSVVLVEVKQERTGSAAPWKEAMIEIDASRPLTVSDAEEFALAILRARFIAEEYNHDCPAR